VNHDDHVRLIERGIARGSGGVWADFGAGSGAFTLALRDLAGPDVAIVAVDRDRTSLRALREAMARRFPDTHLQALAADFTDGLTVPPLDGILSANAIHYVPDHAALLREWRGLLKPDGKLVVVEYDTEAGNRWVPYPMPFAAFDSAARRAGFAPPLLLATRPSRFLGRIYAALAAPASAAGGDVLPTHPVSRRL
jgi:ubiquinone/menaquinone biosynthesis C-methylase UbiE